MTNQASFPVVGRVGQWIDSLGSDLRTYQLLADTHPHPVHSSAYQLAQARQHREAGLGKAESSRGLDEGGNYQLLRFD